MLVFRRSASAVGLGHVDRVVSSASTAKIVPLSEFSGRSPSAGGLKRGSRQRPVQVGDLQDRLRALQASLVADERPVRRIAALDAWFPASLPEDFVAAEKCQIHAGVPGSFHLARCPPTRLVMPHRHEDSVLRDQGLRFGPYLRQWNN